MLEWLKRRVWKARDRPKRFQGSNPCLSAKVFSRRTSMCGVFCYLCPTMEKKLVIIPTYNEIENISKIIRAVFALEGGYHVLVIDDGSPDGTAEAVRNLQLEFPERLHLVERSGKLGLGTAYVAGFRWALERDYDYIFEMDADFSHNPQDLPRLLEACTQGGADMSVGSRYCDGINVVNWPMGKIPAGPERTLARHDDAPP